VRLDGHMRVRGRQHCWLCDERWEEGRAGPGCRPGSMILRCALLVLLLLFYCTWLGLQYDLLLRGVCDTRCGTITTLNMELAYVFALMKVVLWAFDVYFPQRGVVVCIGMLIFSPVHVYKMMRERRYIEGLGRYGLS
jgi:hypothetical protein